MKKIKFYLIISHAVLLTGVSSLVMIPSEAHAMQKERDSVFYEEKSSSNFSFKTITTNEELYQLICEWKKTEGSMRDREVINITDIDHTMTKSYETNQEASVLAWDLRGKWSLEKQKILFGEEGSANNPKPGSILGDAVKIEKEAKETWKEDTTNKHEDIEKQVKNRYAGYDFDSFKTNFVKAFVQEQEHAVKLRFNSFQDLFKKGNEKNSFVVTNRPYFLGWTKSVIHQQLEKLGIYVDEENVVTGHPTRITPKERGSKVDAIINLIKNKTKLDTEKSYHFRFFDDDATNVEGIEDAIKKLGETVTFEFIWTPDNFGDTGTKQSLSGLYKEGQLAEQWLRNHTQPRNFKNDWNSVMNRVGFWGMPESFGDEFMKSYAASKKNPVLLINPKFDGMFPYASRKIVTSITPKEYLKENLIKLNIKNVGDVVPQTLISPAHAQKALDEALREARGRYHRANAEQPQDSRMLSLAQYAIYLRSYGFEPHTIGDLLRIFEGIAQKIDPKGTLELNNLQFTELAKDDLNKPIFSKKISTLNESENTENLLKNIQSVLDVLTGEKAKTYHGSVVSVLREVLSVREVKIWENFENIEKLVENLQQFFKENIYAEHPFSKEIKDTDLKTESLQALCENLNKIWGFFDIEDSAVHYAKKEAEGIQTNLNNKEFLIPFYNLKETLKRLTKRYKNLLDDVNLEKVTSPRTLLDALEKTLNFIKKNESAQQNIRRAQETFLRQTSWGNKGAYVYDETLEGLAQNLFGTDDVDQAAKEAQYINLKTMQRTAMSNLIDRFEEEYTKNPDAETYASLEKLLPLLGQKVIDKEKYNYNDIKNCLVKIGKQAENLSKNLKFRLEKGNLINPENVFEGLREIAALSNFDGWVGVPQYLDAQEKKNLQEYLDNTHLVQQRNIIRSNLFTKSGARIEIERDGGKIQSYPSSTSSYIFGYHDREVEKKSAFKSNPDVLGAKEIMTRNMILLGLLIPDSKEGDGDSGTWNAQELIKGIKLESQAGTKTLNPLIFKHLLPALNLNGHLDEDGSLVSNAVKDFVCKMRGIKKEDLEILLTGKDLKNSKILTDEERNKSIRSVLANKIDDPFQTNHVGQFLMKTLLQTKGHNPYVYHIDFETDKPWKHIGLEETGTKEYNNDVQEMQRFFVQMIRKEDENFQKFLPDLNAWNKEGGYKKNPLVSRADVFGEHEWRLYHSYKDYLNNPKTIKTQFDVWMLENGLSSSIKIIENGKEWKVSVKDPLSYLPEGKKNLEYMNNSIKRIKELNTTEKEEELKSLNKIEKDLTSVVSLEDFRGSPEGQNNEPRGRFLHAYFSWAKKLVGSDFLTKIRVPTKGGSFYLMDAVNSTWVLEVLDLKEIPETNVVFPDQINLKRLEDVLMERAKLSISRKITDECARLNPEYEYSNIVFSINKEINTEKDRIKNLTKNLAIMALDPKNYMGWSPELGVLKEKTLQEKIKEGKKK